MLLEAGHIETAADAVALAGADTGGAEKGVFFDITPFTAQDFPGRLAAILWFAKCDLRCSYCHNAALLRGRGRISLRTALGFLDQRRGKLDGVVLSGGEPLLNPDVLDILRRLRRTDLQIKLDTNGMNPGVLAQVLAENLVDYIACDFKAPAGKLRAVTRGRHVERYRDSLRLLCAQTRVEIEFRTTYHSDLLTPADIQLILDDLGQQGFHGHYYLQPVRTHRTLLPMRASAPLPALATFRPPPGIRLEARG